MKKRRVWMWIGGLAVVLIAVFTIGGLGVLGLLPWQGGDVYEDPQGHFSMKIDPSWEQVETDGRYTQFKVPEPPVNLYIQVLDAGTVKEGFTMAMETVGFDTGLLSGDSVTSFGDWQAYQQDDSAGLTYGLAGQIVGDKAVVIIVKTDKPGVSVENADILRAMMSIKIAGEEQAALDTFAEVEEFVRKEAENMPGTSFSIAVVDLDGIDYTYAYGQANPAAGITADTNTIFQYGSMTKVVTASALMQLVEQGLVDLEAWPGEYIPEFPERWQVTVRQLLTHSACLPHSDRLTDGLIAFPEETFPPLQEVFAAYSKDYPDQVCEPGKSSAYSNPPFLALARIIEEVSGESYVSYVTNHLLTPLGMESTSFAFVEPDERYAKDQYPAEKIDAFVAELNDYRGPGQEQMVLLEGEPYVTLNDYQILPPWGGLRGTPSDATHFVQMHLNGGSYAGTQVLQPQTVAMMQEDQLSSDGSPLGFGLSWWIGEDELGKYFYHSGIGAGSEGTMRIYPGLGVGVVVMSNNRGYQRDRIVTGLVNAWMQGK